MNKKPGEAGTLHLRQDISVGSIEVIERETSVACNEWEMSAEALWMTLERMEFESLGDVSFCTELAFWAASVWVLSS